MDGQKKTTFIVEKSIEWLERKGYVVYIGSKKEAESVNEQDGDEEEYKPTTPMINKS